MRFFETPSTRRFSVAFFAIGLIVVDPIADLTSAWANQPTQSVRPVSPTRPKKNSDLPNFAMVNAGVYRGAAPTAEGLAKLKAMGVRTVVDLRIEKHGQAEEVAAAKSLVLDRIRIPLGREAPTKKQASLFLLILNDPARQPVFVHCQYGADRTGAMIGLYRVTHDGWNFDQAYTEMRKFGFKPYLTELKAAVQERAAAR